jgi:hypothetical protein
MLPLKNWLFDCPKIVPNAVDAAILRVGQAAACLASCCTYFVRFYTILFSALLVTMVAAPIIIALVQ